MAKYYTNTSSYPLAAERYDGSTGADIILAADAFLKVIYEKSSSKLYTL